MRYWSMGRPSFLVISAAAAFVVAAGPTAVAQTATAREAGVPRERQIDRPPRPERVARARERCKAERGVDCDSPEGLREWELQDRSRQEAVQQGSRHIVTVPRR